MAIIRHWFDIVNENDAAKILKEFGEIASENYTYHDPSAPDLKPGLSNILKFMEQNLAASTETKVTLNDLFAVEDKVVARGVWEFIDTATQERNKMEVIVISRFEGGKIKEEWQVAAPIAVPSSE